MHELHFRDRDIMRIAKEADALPHGQRGRYLETQAELLGTSTRTLQAWIQKATGRKRNRRNDAGTHKTPGSEWIGKIVAAEKMKAAARGETARTTSTEAAIKRLEKSGEIKPGVISIRQANRLMKENGITCKKRYRRMDCEAANLVCMFDGSGSEHLAALEEIPGGDFRLRVRTTAEKAKKNRRIKKNGEVDDGGRLLVYYYSTLDYHSRLIFIEPVILRGEDLATSLGALERAWRMKDDHPMIGLPGTLYTDSGPVGRSVEAEELLKSLGVEIITHKPRNAKAKGGVERPWRTLWQQLELDILSSGRKEILFSELKAMLGNYMAEYNRKQSPGFYAGGLSRERAYAESLAHQEVRLLPADINLCNILYSYDWRVVNGDGTISLNGSTYEVKDYPAYMVGEKVLCRRSGIGGMEVRDPKEKNWLPAIDFNPNKFGDFRGFKKDINDDVLEEAAARLKEGPGVLLYDGVRAASDVVVDISSAREARPAADEAARGFANVLDALAFISREYLDGRPIWKVFPDCNFDEFKEGLEEKIHDKDAIRRIGESLYESWNRRSAGGAG